MKWLEVHRLQEDFFSKGSCAVDASPLQNQTTIVTIVSSFMGHASIQNGS